MKRIGFVCLCLFCLCLLFACNAPSGPNKPAEDKEYTVTFISQNASASVAKNEVKVKAGQTVQFSVLLSSTAVFRSVSEGSFDYKTGKLSIPNITKDTRVYFHAEEVGYDTTGEYRLTFVGGATDIVSHSNPNAPIQPGTKITVSANDPFASFLGWSLHAPAASGGTVISTQREYSFDLSPSLVVDGALTLYSNYTDKNSYYYDPNGGSIRQNSRNMTVKSTYRTKIEGNRLCVSISSREMEELGCASLFYNDGTFYRDGYVLLEYNTEKDGSGEGYSLGSKFSMQAENRVLYCIWAEVEPESMFSYTDFSLPFPAGVSAENVPGWNPRGVQIRAYGGNAETVVIPETLGGKAVISIASGAFDHCSNMKTLVFSKNLLQVEDGAFTNLSALDTVYYSDGIYDIGNAALDASGYATLRHFIVNATTPPRFSKGDGALAKKFCRLISNTDKPRIIVIAGSSARQGLATPYLESLLDKEYTVINFGTTRTTQGFLYLEAMQNYANEKDIILYSPENSAYMMGEGTLYWKTLRDMEGMYNLFRYIDIRGYSNVFGAFAELNSGYAEVPGVDICNAPRYNDACPPCTYEDILDATGDDVYGDYQHAFRSAYRSACLAAYQDAYVITLNNRFKSRFDFGWDNTITDYWKTDDWKDAQNESWCNIDDPYFRDNMNRAILAAKSTGAKVYFSFCPVDVSRICEQALADIDAWCADYEEMLKETYAFDGILGKAKDYIMHHEYFYDNAFHPNDYGRTYRTYQLYFDLCALLSMENVHPLGYVDFTDPALGTSQSIAGALRILYAGCGFEFALPGETVLQKPKFSAFEEP